MKVTDFKDPRSVKSDCSDDPAYAAFSSPDVPLKFNLGDYCCLVIPFPD